MFFWAGSGRRVGGDGRGRHDTLRDPVPPGGYGFQGERGTILWGGSGLYRGRKILRISETPLVRCFGGRVEGGVRLFLDAE